MGWGLPAIAARERLTFEGGGSTMLRWLIAILLVANLVALAAIQRLFRPPPAAPGHATSPGT